MRNSFLKVFCGTVLSTLLVIANAAAQTRPSLIADGDGVHRLPKSVGNVHRILKGDFVKGAPTSFIAFGEKRISLCYKTHEPTVTCTPVVSSSVLKDIQVSTFVQNGISYLRLTHRPGTKKESASLRRADKNFVRNFGIAVGVLQRHSTRESGPGSNSSFVAEGGGGCSLDEDGNVTCTESPGSGGGGGNCWDCDYPGGDESPPPDNPEDDEGTVPAGNAGTPCVVTPIGVVCTITPPPVVGGVPPVEDLPSTPPRPEWTWCDRFGLFCGWSNPIANQSEAYEEAIHECLQQYDRDMTECNLYRRAVGPEKYRICMERSAKYLRDCQTKARGDFPGR
jgi:hypothetical protein